MQEIIHVGAPGSPKHGSPTSTTSNEGGSELTQAIRAAKPGHVIRIHAGTYIESDGISITGSDITLENAGDGIAMISALNGPIVITASVTVRGLHFVARDPSLPAVTIASGEPKLTRCTIQSLHVDIDARPTVEDCLISGSTSSGLIVSGAASGTYRNNIIKLHSGYGVHSVSTGSPVFEGNFIMRTGCGAVCVSGVSGYCRLEHNLIQDSRWVHGQELPSQAESADEEASALKKQQQQQQNKKEQQDRIRNTKSVGAGAVPTFVWEFAADEGAGMMSVTTRAAVTVCGGASAYFAHNTVYNSCAHGIIVASKWSVRVPFRKHNLGVLATTALTTTSRASAASAASMVGTRKTQKLVASVDMAVAKMAGLSSPSKPPADSDVFTRLTNSSSSSSGIGGKNRAVDAAVAANERKASEALAVALEHVETGNVVVPAAPTKCIVAFNEVRSCTLTGLWACGQMVEVECAGNNFEQLGCEGVRVDQGGFAYLHHETIAFFPNELPRGAAAAAETVGFQCSGLGSSSIVQDVHIKGAHTGIAATDCCSLTVQRATVAECSMGVATETLAQVSCEDCTLERHEEGCRVDTTSVLRMTRSGISRCCTGVTALRGGKPEMVDCGLVDNVVAVRGTEAAGGFLKNCRFMGSEQIHVELATLAHVRFEDCSFGRVVSGRAMVECRARCKGKFQSNNFELVPRAAPSSASSSAAAAAAAAAAVPDLPREVQCAAVFIESGGDPEFDDNVFAVSSSTAAAAAAVVQQASKPHSAGAGNDGQQHREDSLTASFSYDGAFVYPNCFVVVTRGGLGLFRSNMFIGEAPPAPTPEQLQQSSKGSKQLTFVVDSGDGAATASGSDHVHGGGEDPNCTSATSSIKSIVGDARAVRGFQTMRGGDPVVRSNTFEQMKGEAIFVSEAGAGSFERNLFVGASAAAALPPSKQSGAAAAASSPPPAVALARFYGSCGAAQLRSNEFVDVFLGVLTEDGAAPCIARNVFHGSTYVGIRCRSDSKPAILQNGFRRSEQLPGIEQLAVRQRFQQCAVLEISQSGTAPYVAFNTIIDNTNNLLHTGGATSSPGKASSSKQHQHGGRSAIGAVYITNEASPTLHGNIIAGEQVGVTVDGAASPRMMSNLFTMNELAVCCIGSAKAALVDNAFYGNDRGLLAGAAPGAPHITSSTHGSNPSWINSHLQPAPRTLRHDQIHPLSADDEITRKFLQQDEKPPPLAFPKTVSEREAAMLEDHRKKQEKHNQEQQKQQGEEPSSPHMSPLNSFLSTSMILHRAGGGGGGGGGDQANCSSFDEDDSASSFHLLTSGNVFLSNGAGAVLRGGANVWMRSRDAFVSNRTVGLLVVGGLTGGEVAEAVFHDNASFNIVCVGGPTFCPKFLGVNKNSSGGFSPSAPSSGSGAKRRKSMAGGAMAAAAAAATAALSQSHSGSASGFGDADSSGSSALALSFMGCVFSGLDSQVSCRRKRNSTFFRNCLVLASLISAETGAAPVVHGSVIKWRSDTDACASIAVSAESDARPMLVDCSLRGVADGFMLRRCGALISHCIIRKARGVGLTIGENFFGLVTRCHISANGCGGVVVLGKSNNNNTNCSSSGSGSNHSLAAITYCRIFDHQAPKTMLSSQQASGSNSNSLYRPEEEPFSGVEVDAATKTEAMTSLVPRDDFSISIIGPESLSPGGGSSSSGGGGGGGGFKEQPMVAGAPALLSKFYPSGVDGSGVGLFIGEAGGVHVAETQIFGNAVANLVYKSRFASRVEGSVLSDSHLFGIVVEPGARDLTVVDCDIKENGLAGVLALPGSASAWLHTRIMRNPIGVSAIADSCTAFGSCWFGHNMVTGCRFVQNSRARVEDCFFNSNACAAEFWGAPHSGSTSHTYESERRQSLFHGAADDSSSANKKKKRTADQQQQQQSEFGHLIFNNNDISNSTFCGVVVSGDCAPKLYRNIFRSHRGVAALMTRRGARPVVSCGFFCNNAFGIVTRLGAEPSVSQNVLVDNETGVMCEWRSAGLFSLNSLTRCNHAAVTCRTAANPHFLYCLFDECAPVIVTTEGQGVYESLTFREPRSQCFVINRGGDPLIRNSSFALLHLVHRDKIFQKVKAIIKSDNDVWRPPVIAVTHNQSGGGGANSAGEQHNQEDQEGGEEQQQQQQQPAPPAAASTTSNNYFTSASSYGPSAAEHPPPRAKSGAHINSFARIAAAATEIMREADEHVLLTSTSVVEQPTCVIKVEHGGKCTVEKCLFLLNGCSSIVAIGALSSVCLERNVFSSHLRLPAVLIANLATGTLRDNLFSHNLRGVHMVRANPSVADCLFTANSLSLEAGAGATVFVSNCQFVDDVLGVSALEGSYVTVKSSQFIGCEVGSLFAKGAQAVFSDNAGSWCSGATAVLRTSADHQGTVERCTFYGGSQAVQVEDNSAVNISGLDCVGVEQVALLVGDCLSVTVTDCKMRNCKVGIKCTGAKSAALIEKCALTFNRIGVDVAGEGANPSIVGCSAAFNDTGLRFHDGALGTVQKLEANDNRVGVALESGVEGFPSLTQCSIFDGEIGLLLDGDAVGECKRSAVHGHSTACIMARGRTMTEIGSSTLSTPVSSSSETQLLIVNAEDSRLRVQSDVNLCFNQKPAHRGKTPEQRAAEAGKHRKDHTHFLESADERFRREERLARAMVERWISDVGACSTHAVDPDAPLNLLHRVLVVSSASSANVFAGSLTVTTHYPFSAITPPASNSDDNTATKPGDSSGGGGGGGDDPQAKQQDPDAAPKKPKFSLKKAAKKITDASHLVKNLGGGAPPAGGAEQQQQREGGDAKKASALSAAAQALSMTSSLVGNGSGSGIVEDGSNVAALLEKSGLDQNRQQQTSNSSSSNNNNSSAPLTGIVTVDAVVELVIVYGRRAARCAVRDAHEKFGDTPASIDLELVRLGVATQNTIKCGARADEHHSVNDFVSAVAASAAAADSGAVLTSEGGGGGTASSKRRRSTFVGEGGDFFGESGAGAGGGEGAIPLAAENDDDDELPPIEPSKPTKLKDRRRDTITNQSQRGGKAAAAGSRGHRSKRAIAGNLATSLRPGHNPAHQPKRSPSRGSGGNIAPRSSSSLGQNRSGSKAGGARAGHLKVGGGAGGGGRISPVSGRSTPVRGARTARSSNNNSGARSSSRLGNSNSNSSSMGVFHRSESRGGNRRENSASSKSLSVRHNSNAATAGAKDSDSTEQRAKDVLRKFMETMNPDFDVAEEALGSVVQDVVAAKSAKKSSTGGGGGGGDDDDGKRSGSATPTSSRPGSSNGSSTSQRKVDRDDIVIQSLKAAKEAPISLLPPITRLSQNHLILPEREFYMSQQPSTSSSSITPRRKLDDGARPDQAGVLLPFLRPFPPSRLALDCFTQPQPHKFGYGAATHAAVVKLAGAHNALFADQVLHAFARADRQKRERLSCADVALFILQLCEQYRFEPTFDEHGAFDNNESMLHTSSAHAAAAAAVAANASSGVQHCISGSGSDAFGPTVEDEGGHPEDDQLTTTVQRWVRDAWIDILFMPDTACEVGLGDFAKIVLLKHSPFETLFRSHFTWIHRKMPAPTG